LHNFWVQLYVDECVVDSTIAATAMHMDDPEEDYELSTFG
jgi:hypothetical protein